MEHIPKKVHVVSRMEMEKILSRPSGFEQDKSQFDSITDDNVENYLVTSIISILDSSGPYGNRLFKRDHPNVLTLRFDDVTKPGDPSPTVRTNTIAFNDEMAEKLYNFIISVKSISEMVVVHCAAGISRSGAVGTFINDLYGNEDYLEFMRRHPQVFPNPLILKKLRDIHGRQMGD